MGSEHHPYSYVARRILAHAHALAHRSAEAGEGHLLAAYASDAAGALHAVDPTLSDSMTGRIDALVRRSPPHVGDGPTSFSADLRRALGAADRLSNELGDDMVWSSTLLAAVLEGDTPAGALLRGVGLTRDAVLAVRGLEARSKTYTLAPTVRTVLVDATALATRLSRAEIRAEHVLLASSLDPGGPLSVIVAALGLDHERLESELTALAAARPVSADSTPARLSLELVDALGAAEEYSRRQRELLVSTAALLVGLGRGTGEGAEVLRRAGIVRDGDLAVCLAGSSTERDHWTPLTPRATALLRGAERLASSSRHDRVRAGHLVAALVADVDGILQQIAGDVPQPQLRAEATALCDAYPTVPDAGAPWSHELRAVLGAARLEAQRAGEPRITTAALLLATAAHQGSVGAFLCGHGVNAEAVRSAAVPWDGEHERQVPSPAEFEPVPEVVAAAEGWVVAFPLDEQRRNRLAMELELLAARHDREGDAAAARASRRIAVAARAGRGPVIAAIEPVDEARWSEIGSVLLASLPSGARVWERRGSVAIRWWRADDVVAGAVVEEPLPDRLSAYDVVLRVERPTPEFRAWALAAGPAAPLVRAMREAEAAGSDVVVAALGSAEVNQLARSLAPWAPSGELLLFRMGELWTIPLDFPRVLRHAPHTTGGRPPAPKRPPLAPAVAEAARRAAAEVATLGRGLLRPCHLAAALAAELPSPVVDGAPTLRQDLDALGDRAPRSSQPAEWTREVLRAISQATELAGKCGAPEVSAGAVTWCLGVLDAEVAETLRAHGLGAEILLGTLLPSRPTTTRYLLAPTKKERARILTRERGSLLAEHGLPPTLVRLRRREVSEALWSALLPSARDFDRDSWVGDVDTDDRTVPLFTVGDPDEDGYGVFGRDGTLLWTRLFTTSTLTVEQFWPTFLAVAVNHEDPPEALLRDDDHPCLDRLTALFAAELGVDVGRDLAALEEEGWSWPRP